MDLGTSTGLYTRGLAKAGGEGAQIVALDNPWGMLALARGIARREGLKNVSFLRALAQRLPLAGSRGSRFREKVPRILVPGMLRCSLTLAGQKSPSKREGQRRRSSVPASEKAIAHAGF